MDTFFPMRTWTCSFFFRSFLAISGGCTSLHVIFPSDSCGLHAGPNVGPSAQRIGHTSEASFEPSEARPQLRVCWHLSAKHRSHGNMLVDDRTLASYCIKYLFPSEDVFPCNCCKNFHANMHGYCNSHRLSRFHRQFFSRCHFVPRLPQLHMGDFGLTVPYTTCRHLLGLSTIDCVVVGDILVSCSCMFMSSLVNSLEFFWHVINCPSVAWGFSMVRATADFLSAGCGRYWIKSLAGLDHCLFVPRLHQNCFQNHTCPTQSFLF